MQAIILPTPASLDLNPHTNPPNVAIPSPVFFEPVFSELTTIPQPFAAPNYSPCRSDDVVSLERLCFDSLERPVEPTSHMHLPTPTIQISKSPTLLANGPHSPSLGPPSPSHGPVISVDNIELHTSATIGPLLNNGSLAVETQSSHVLPPNIHKDILAPGPADGLRAVDGLPPVDGPPPISVDRAETQPAAPINIQLSSPASRVLRRSARNIQNQGTHLSIISKAEQLARVRSLEAPPPARTPGNYSQKATPARGSLSIPQAINDYADNEILIVSTSCGFIFSDEAEAVVARIREMENMRAHPVQ